MGFLTGGKNLKVGKDLKIREMHGDECWAVEILYCEERSSMNQYDFLAFPDQH